MLRYIYLKYTYGEGYFAGENRPLVPLPDEALSLTQTGIDWFWRKIPLVNLVQVNLVVHPIKE